VNQHLLVDSITKLSELDIVLLYSTNFTFSFKTLFLSLIFDVNTEFSNLYFFETSLLSSNFQDIFATVLVLSPELTLAFSDYFTSYFSESKFNFIPSAIFDSYANNLNYSFSDSNAYFIMFFFYCWFLIYFFILSNTLKWSLNFSNH